MTCNPNCWSLMSSGGRERRGSALTSFKDGQGPPRWVRSCRACLWHTYSAPAALLGTAQRPKQTKRPALGGADILEGETQTGNK